MNLARHLLATGQAAAAHQQAMHNNNAMKGMIYHGGMRSSVVPLNASKCREESAWWFFKDSFLGTGEYLESHLHNGGKTTYSDDKKKYKIMKSGL